jgi:hypothetical protein
MKKLLAFTFLACSLFLNTASAQTCPGFPARGIQVIDALYNPALAMGDDDQRRTLTRTIIEQIVFEFPSEGWTWKSADPGRPPSKDSIARLINGRLCNWDWQNGATRLRSVQAGQLGDDITGQHPIPVAGVNHLGGTPSPEPTPTPPTDLSGIISRLEALRIQNESLYAQAERIFADERARDAAHDERLRMHADDTRSFLDSLRAFVTNGKTLAVVAGLLAGRFAVPQ